MEAKQKPLPYADLKKAAGELSINYQKLQQAYESLRERYEQAVEALNDREFQYNAFFLDKLIAVVNNSEKYDQKFVEWAVQNVQASLLSFAKAGEEAAKKAQEAEKKEEKKDEA